MYSVLHSETLLRKRSDVRVVSAVARKPAVYECCTNVSETVGSHSKTKRKIWYDQIAGVCVRHTASTIGCIVWFGTKHFERRFGNAAVFVRNSFDAWPQNGWKRFLSNIENETYTKFVISVSLCQFHKRFISCTFFSFGWLLRYIYLFVLNCCVKSKQSRWVLAFGCYTARNRTEKSAGS